MEVDPYDFVLFETQIDFSLINKIYFNYHL